MKFWTIFNTILYLNNVYRIIKLRAFKCKHITGLHAIFILNISLADYHRQRKLCRSRFCVFSYFDVICIMYSVETWKSYTKWNKVMKLTDHDASAISSRCSPRLTSSVTGNLEALNLHASWFRRWKFAYSLNFNYNSILFCFVSLTSRCFGVLKRNAGKGRERQVINWGNKKNKKIVQDYLSKTKVKGKNNKLKTIAMQKINKTKQRTKFQVDS